MSLLLRGRTVIGKNLGIAIDQRGLIERVGVPSSFDSSLATAFQVDGYLLPGFLDSHTHPHGGGLQLLGVDLRKGGSLHECISRIKSYRETTQSKPGEWIIGAGWELHWFERGHPIANDLDEIGPENPIYMRDRDGHQVWVNSTALKVEFSFFFFHC